MPVLSPEDGGPSGPGQQGRRSNGQYVYWIVMSQPTPAGLASHGFKRPEHLSREELSKLMEKVHKEYDVTLVERACFLEPHASGLMHHNSLGRADAQYRCCLCRGMFRQLGEVAAVVPFTALSGPGSCTHCNKYPS